MTEPCELSALEARRLIGRKRLSPIELLESCIARIEMVNAAVNAVVATCYERAREEARAATDAVMRGDALGPLHGLRAGFPWGRPPRTGRSWGRIPRRSDARPRHC